MQIKVSDFTYARNSRVRNVAVKPEPARGWKTVYLKSRVVLLVRKPCQSCDEAERVWHDVASHMGVRLEVHDLDDDPRSPEFANITALPALLVDGSPLIVGVPRADDATSLLRQALAGE